MAHSHSHSHHHEHVLRDFGCGFQPRPRRVKERRRLQLAIGLNVAMMIAEVIGGIWTHSLALLSDAGHMLTHIFALVVSFVAIVLAERQTDDRNTFGYHRAEPIGALINAITILLVVIVIFAEAIRKFITPVDVQAREMFVVAVAGLVVNLVGAFILRSPAKSDINIRGAFIHLLTDMISSVAIVLGGAVIMQTGWNIVDPILSVIISAIIAVWGVRLLKDAVGMLMEAAPDSISVPEVSRRIAAVPGVKLVHDLHVWQVTSGLYAMTCHVRVEDVSVRETETIRDHVNEMVSREFGIGHTTLQFEVHRPPA